MDPDMARVRSCEASSSRSAAPKPKLTCLCAPTSHPGSFRCIRHRSPRVRPPSSSGGTGATGRGEARVAASAKGRSVRAHLLQMISPSGRDRRRRRDFQPRPSRLRQCAS
ncbi:hypothetical protein GUJ93_ZPchr0002g26064 [Zizania palustris]|uniref:Uncharacterized protein n=1 Tax=Zizania palustris TaxID=103762 RepID=A0A8J5S5I6_ZIZPA|nr:hypothetical protein GUJ93_ZPchr0002g26064 [Zizania palustris]